MMTCSLKVCDTLYMYINYFIFVDADKHKKDGVCGNSNVASSSFTSLCHAKKSTNVNSNRNMINEQQDTCISWYDYLIKTDALFCEKLLVPYVCTGSFDSVSVMHAQWHALYITIGIRKS